MELLNFSRNNNLESLCQIVLKSERKLQQCIKMITQDKNWIENNFDGTLCAETLCEVIKRSISNKKYCYFLTSIIDFVEGNVIDDNIFIQLMSFPDYQVKEYFEVSLSHKKLNEKQLIFLCRSQKNFECFFELAILYYTREVYNINILDKFIKYFSRCKYSYMMKELLVELKTCCKASSPEKERYVEKKMSAYRIICE